MFRVGVFEVRGFGYGVFVYGVSGSSFRDLGFLQVHGFEYRVLGTGFLIRGLAIRGFGYGVTGFPGMGFRVQGFGGSGTGFLVI